MLKIKQFFKKWSRDEEGASAMEYALMAAMVAVVVAAFITPISEKVKGVFQTISDNLPAGGSSGGSGS
jgi:pilus assembly protein Flp/PilA